MAEFDIKKVQGNDRYIAGGAVLLLLVSFFSWRAFSASGFSVSVNAWGNGSYGWPKLAILLSLVAGGIVVARLMGALDSVQLPAGVNLITLAATGLATVILLLQFLAGFSHHLHPAFGFYLGIVISGAMTYFAFLNFKHSGEQLPSKPASNPPAPGYPPPGS